MMDANCLFECNMNLGKNLGMALLSSIVIHPAQLMAVNQVNKYADINETVSPLTHMFFAMEDWQQHWQCGGSWRIFDRVEARDVLVIVS